MREDFNFGQWLAAHKVLLGSIGVVLLIGLSLWGKSNSVWNEGVQWESDLNASYKSAQNDLSSYESGFYETIGVANLKSAKLDKILTDAVKGRYEGHTSAQPGQGQLFSAIKEAYPNLDLGVYDKVVDYIKGGREKFRNKQDDLISRLQHYDVWRRSGIFQHLFVKWWGFPSDDLTACAAPNDCLYGKDAEKRMWTIVTTEGTQRAYQTGTMKPLTVPQN